MTSPPDVRLESECELVELDLPAKPEVVAVARLVVGALAGADPLFSEDRAADLRLAVSEACTNAIQAQRRRAIETEVLDPINLRFEVASGCIAVTVEDHGGGFDPGDLTSHPEVTDPERLHHERGLGIPLLQFLSDDVDFRPTDDGTIVAMTFLSSSDDEFEL